jgi:hypothetical protein
MRILDLYAGLGGERRRAAIEARGHKLVTLDYCHKFGCTITGDIMAHSTVKEILAHGPYDFIWASPPCECFSVASIGTYWNKDDRSPKNDRAILAQSLVAQTLSIINKLQPPKGWVMENPRGMLRKLPVVAGLDRVTVTYCQYGEKTMKPTDLWHAVEGWTPRPPCKNGAPCHEAAPRGSRTGIQGMKNPAERAVVPWDLWDEILTVIE